MKGHSASRSQSIVLQRQELPPATRLPPPSPQVKKYDVAATNPVSYDYIQAVSNEVPPVLGESYLFSGIARFGRSHRVNCYVYDVEVDPRSTFNLQAHCGRSPQLKKISKYVSQVWFGFWVNDPGKYNNYHHAWKPVDASKTLIWVLARPGTAKTHFSVVDLYVDKEAPPQIHHVRCPSNFISVDLKGNQNTRVQASCGAHTTLITTRSNGNNVGFGLACAFRKAGNGTVSLKFNDGFGGTVEHKITGNPVNDMKTAVLRELYEELAIPIDSILFTSEFTMYDVTLRSEENSRQYKFVNPEDNSESYTYAPEGKTPKIRLFSESPHDLHGTFASTCDHEELLETFRTARQPYEHAVTSHSVFLIDFKDFERYKQFCNKNTDDVTLNILYAHHIHTEENPFETFEKTFTLTRTKNGEEELVQATSVPNTYKANARTQKVPKNSTN